MVKRFDVSATELCHSTSAADEEEDILNCRAIYCRIKPSVCRVRDGRLQFDQLALKSKLLVWCI